MPPEVITKSYFWTMRRAAPMLSSSGKSQSSIRATTAIPYISASSSGMTSTRFLDRMRQCMLSVTRKDMHYRSMPCWKQKVAKYWVFLSSTFPLRISSLFESFSHPPRGQGFDRDTPDDQSSSGPDALPFPERVLGHRGDWEGELGEAWGGGNSDHVLEASRGEGGRMRGEASTSMGRA